MFSRLSAPVSRAITPRMLKGFATAAVALALLGCPRSRRGNGGEGGVKTAKVYYLTELKGQIEPCGCTSDPLGDLARIAPLVGRDKRLVVDAGGALFEHTKLFEKDAPQARLKAELVARAYRDMPVDVVGVGPEDLAAGVGAVAPGRTAENLPQLPGVQPGRVHAVGGLKIGVFALVDAEDPAMAALGATDPLAAANAAVARLRGEGAEVVIALAHLTRAKTKQLARAARGIDFAVVGQGVELGGAPELVGGAWVLLPAEKGQKLGQLDLHVSGARPAEGPMFADAIGPHRAADEIAQLDERIPRLRADIQRWAAAPDADQQFLATKRAELAELEARRSKLAASPLQKPERGSWFTSELTPIKKGLECAPAIVDDKRALTAKIGELNLAAARAAGGPLPPEPGKPKYVGIDECESCHKPQVEFWKNTVHARAWGTLEVLGKQLDRDCIGCHVTGFDEPGGTTLATQADAPLMRNVQCEMCHGPASFHVDKDGQDKPRTISLDTPEATCKGCHPPEHSDTFEYTAYLRDVLGGSEDSAAPRHGYERWKQLGAGPTGHGLRAAALAKAGASVGKGCPK